MSEKDALAAISAAQVGSAPAKKQAPVMVKSASELLGRREQLLTKAGAVLAAAGTAQAVLPHVGAVRYLRDLASEEHDACLELANAEFRACAKNQTGQLVIPCGPVAASFRRYTAPARWQYPPEIEALEDQLKKAKKAAQENGSAVRLPQESGAEFSVSVAPIVGA